MNEKCRLTSFEMRDLCIRENWFTSGSIRQYERLFQELKRGVLLHDVALIIWICSNNVSVEQIETKIRKEQENKRW